MGKLKPGINRTTLLLNGQKQRNIRGVILMETRFWMNPGMKSSWYGNQKKQSMKVTFGTILLITHNGFTNPGNGNHNQFQMNY